MVSGGSSPVTVHGLIVVASLVGTDSGCTGLSICSTRAQELQLTGSRAPASWLWPTGSGLHGMWDPCLGSTES